MQVLFILVLNLVVTWALAEPAAQEDIINQLQNIRNAQILQQDIRFQKSLTAEKIREQHRRGVALVLRDNPTYRKLEKEQADSRDSEKNLIAQLMSWSTFSELPESIVIPTSNPYKKTERLVIDKTLFLRLMTSRHSYPFIMDSYSQDDYALELSSDVIDPLLEDKVHVDLTCDGEFVLSKGNRYGDGPLVRSASFDLLGQGQSYRRNFLRPTKNLQSCELRIFKSSAPQRKYLITLKTNRNMISARLNSESEACLLPTSQKFSPAQSLYYDSQFQQMGCPLAVDNFHILYDPVDGLNQKIKALLGRVVPREILERQDPFFDLDFTQAPKLQAIYISYLVFRHDFYGTLMLRLLEWHAQHGAEIKIMTSQVIAIEKDNVAIRELERKYPNVKFIPFQYPGRWSRGLKDKFNSLHRTNHLKMFITIAEKEKDNLVIIGGRNIHDGFVFKSTPYYSKYPDMIQYGSGGDEAFVHWMDLEVLIQSRKAAWDSARQMLAAWNFDDDSVLFAPVNIQLPRAAENFDFKDGDRIQVRQVMSGPYRDDHALERFYERLFSSAKKKIQIVSPYLRFTPGIEKSLLAAMGRGVEISIYTRINLNGDTADLLLTDVNKAAINKHKDKMAIYEWLEPGVILHSKLVLVDNEISFIGGINLNKRSFFHDWENGFLVYSKKVNSDFQSIVDRYQEGSRLVTNDQKTKWWTGFIIRIFDTEL